MYSYTAFMSADAVDGQFQFSDCVITYPSTLIDSVTSTRIVQGTGPTYDPEVSVSICLIRFGTEYFSPTKRLGQTAGFAQSAEVQTTPGINPSEQIIGSGAIRESADFRESGLLVATDSVAQSAGLSRSSNWRPSQEVSGSTGFAASDELKVSESGARTAEIEGTRILEGTDAMSPSQEFSASPSFTERKDRYRRGRPIMELSGYLFFVFFYGDRQ
jgi:hypothetical protein